MNNKFKPLWIVFYRFHGLEKFLAKKPFKIVDYDTLYVIKRNLTCRCSIYKSTITNAQSIETKIKCMYTSFTKDMQIIGPNSVIQFNARKSDIKLFFRSFEDDLKVTKEIINIIVVDFIKVA